MPIIILSSDIMEEEKEIAEKIVRENGYRPLNRDILPEIEAKYHIDSGKLAETLDTVPSFLKQIVSNQWKYRLACIEAEVLTRLMEDNTVCWGLSAHLYVLGISHALKARVIGHEKQEKITDMQNMRMKKAEKILDMEQAKRKKWSLAAYNRDDSDPALYDLIINLNQIDRGEAVYSIISASGYRKFQPITYSTKCLADLALAAKVRTSLLKSAPDVDVQARDGTVLVYTKAFKQNKLEKIKQIKELAGQIEGVGCVEVHVTKNLFGDKGISANQ